jgi:hypothetical protein
MAAKRQRPTFLVSRDPPADLWEKISLFAPQNPFLTPQYAAARTSLGDTLIVLSETASTNRPTLGFLRRGRLASTLNIPSLLGTPSEDFVSGLRQFCESEGIYETTLNTFASPSLTIPALPHEAQRIPRTEFAFDLCVNQSDWKLGSTHRRHIRQAEKNGVEIRRTVQAENVQQHIDLIASSMTRRRNRGESVAISHDNPEVWSITRSGSGELFQAIADDVVLSSVLVMRSKTGGYDHSSGTSAEGMAIGASHLLVLSIARQLQLEGCSTLNLGGARAEEEGLRRFKTAFGTVTTELVMVRASMCTPARRACIRAFRSIRRAPGRFRALLRGRPPHDRTDEL